MSPRVAGLVVVLVIAGCSAGADPDWFVGSWRIDPAKSLPFAREHPRFEGTDERALALLEERAATTSLAVTTTSLEITMGSRAQSFDVTVASVDARRVVFTTSFEGEPVRFSLERVDDVVRLHSDESDDLSIYVWVPRTAP